MTDLTLVIGNKNYSSWSMRPWPALRESAAMEFAIFRQARESLDR